MKLYTEEQVNQIIDLAEFGRHTTNQELLSDFTPIELPSDDEIDESKFPSNSPEQELYNNGYEQGAKWMRYKLTNTEKK